ncbi:MAG: sigma-70 family RNA polymerase sigma factor [Aggregatilineales bacterium]
MDQTLIVLLFASLAGEMQDDQEPISIDVAAAITRAQAGDRQAVAELYQAHVHQIYRYIAVRVSDPADVEDLTADVFVRMVEGLSTYQMTGAPFEAWLYRIAASRVVDYYRAKSRGGAVALSDIMAAPGETPEQEMIETQGFDLLRAALHALPEVYQLLLILRFVERKSHEETARILGRSLSSVKSMQHRALTRLAEQMGLDQKARHYLRGEDG